MNISRRGQSLLEVIVALGIIVVVLVGLVRVTTLSVKNTSSSQNEALTARYGTEVSEWLKNNKDNLGWVAFISNLSSSSKLGNIASDSTWCLPGPLTTIGTGFQNSFTNPASCGVVNGTNNLTRTVAIGTTLPMVIGSTRDQSVQFTIDITWNDGTVARKAEYITQITSTQSP